MSISGQKILRTGIFALAFFLAPALPLQANDAGPRVFESFSALRHEVLDVIAGAQKRIWLSCDYLTDGEIVSALYVARYRKLDVTVLLGRAKANRYMSRLNYLKNQSIPVFLKPASFQTKHATAILADDQLVLVDGELDFMAKYKRYTLTKATAGETRAFEKSFAAAVNLKVPAVPRPVPLVGRPNPKAPVFRPPTPRYDPDSGAYTYDRAKEPRPADVPARLPKSTIWQERARAQEQGNQPSPMDGATETRLDGGSQ